VELIVIGAGPAYTDRRGAAASSYLLLAEGAALLLDLGQGAFSNLSAHVEPSALTAVLISHLHPDHFVDLVPLRHYLKWEFDPPRRVRVIGPARLVDRLDGLDGQPGFAAVSLDTEDLSEGVIRVGPFEVEARRVTHTEDSYAFRVTCASGGNAAGSRRSSPGIVYSGDCSCADDLLPLIHAGDTLLCEASFGAGPVAPGAQHITAADAAQAASVGGASRLLLTHVLSGHSRAEIVDSANSVFSGPVQLVTEGDRFVA
jgi:ribonuclease BN (tRNA processing enzyme)